jgi:hypothetical protein
MGELTGAALPPRVASGNPTIHIGPRAQHIDREVGRPSSRTVRDPTPGHPERVIDYPRIGAGRTRRERNAPRSSTPTTSALPSLPLRDPSAGRL